MAPQRLTPNASTYSPELITAFGIHDPDRSRGYLFQKIVEQTGHPPTITIGRSRRSDIIVRHDWISRRHAVVYRGDDPFWYIKPDQPTNGLFINGQPVFDSTRLLLGMRIRVGKAYLYTTNAQGLILVAGLTDDDYLARTGDLYGDNSEAARRVGKSRETIGDRRSVPWVRERRRQARLEARRRASEQSSRQSENESPKSPGRESSH